MVNLVLDIGLRIVSARILVVTIHHSVAVTGNDLTVVGLLVPNEAQRRDLRGVIGEFVNYLEGTGVDLIQSAVLNYEK